MRTIINNTRGHSKQIILDGIIDYEIGERIEYNECLMQTGKEDINMKISYEVISRENTISSLTINKLHSCSATRIYTVKYLTHEIIS